jgi:hypothetical protein
MYTLPLVCLLAAPAAAPEAVPPRRLTLTPAPATSPALKYRLLPDTVEQRAGNAAPHYARAAAVMRTKLSPDDLPFLAQTLDLPPDRLPVAGMRKVLAAAEEALAEAECGARCDTCDWGLTERVRKDGINVVIPELGEMRNLTTLVLARMRLELADGRTRQALRTASVSLAMARHVGDSPTLIGGLVGIAMATLTFNVLEDEMQRPDAPNLYWSLTDLPRPFVDLRKPLQGERLIAYSTFTHLSELADPDAPPLSREQVREMADKVIVNSQGLEIPVYNRVVLSGMLVQKHENSKKALIAAGRPRERVEAMTPLEVSLLHSFLEYDRELDEIMRAQSLPYWEAKPILEKARARLRPAQPLARALPDQPVLPLAGYLIPAGDKVLMSRTRLDRRVAALRCIEAVRLHAAAHGGRWPRWLDQVTEAPVPLDPATGKPFDYRVEDGTAYLSGPDVFPGKPNKYSSVRYVLTLRKEE